MLQGPKSVSRSKMHLLFLHPCCSGNLSTNIHTVTSTTCILPRPICTSDGVEFALVRDSPVFFYYFGVHSRRTCVYTTTVVGTYCFVQQEAVQVLSSSRNPTRPFGGIMNGLIFRPKFLQIISLHYRNAAVCYCYVDSSLFYAARGTLERARGIKLQREPRERAFGKFE